LAIQLAKQGAILVLASRNKEKLEEVALKCRELGTKAIAIPTDVSIEGQCRHLLEKTLKEFGRIDTLINNAGFGIRGNFEEYKNLDLFRRLIDVNFYGPVYCTKYALPYLKQTKGRIVAISSVLGKVTTPGNTAYCGSKHAMAGFFDSLRLELRNSGVTITMAYPGYVVTEFAERMINPDGTLQGTKGQKFYAPWMLTPQRCADVIIKAAAKRKRQVIMTPYGVVGAWLSVFAPSLLDYLSCLVSKFNKERVGK